MVQSRRFRVYGPRFRVQAGESTIGVQVAVPCPVGAELEKEN